MESDPHWALVELPDPELMEYKNQFATFSAQRRSRTAAFRTLLRMMSLGKCAGRNYRIGLEPPPRRNAVEW